jgi:hypothetical protein
MLSQQIRGVTLRGDVQGDACPDHEKELGRAALVPNQGGPMLTQHGSAKRKWFFATDRSAKTGGAA